MSNLETIEVQWREKSYQGTNKGSYQRCYLTDLETETWKWIEKEDKKKKK